MHLRGQPGVEGAFQGTAAALSGLFNLVVIQLSAVAVMALSAH